MTDKQFSMLIAILFICFAFIAGIVFALGIRIGHHQAEDWSQIKEHYEMEIKGYNYCPYCGERLQEVEE